MKFLRNPIVTGALVILAVIVVYLQIFPHAHLFSFGGGARAPLPVTPAPAPTPAAPLAPTSVPVAARQTAETKAEADISPRAAVDRQFVELHFDGWVNWPQRDPFLVMEPDPLDAIGKDEGTNSPVTSWKLMAIYAQAGSPPLAVINRGVYGEGDEIQGYKIIKIEGDEVWFQGPRRKERLGFGRRMPAHP